MVYLHPFPPTKIVSPPKAIDEDAILPILEKHIADYHQPPAITTNALVGSSLEKLVSALKGIKPDLTIHEEVEEPEEDVEMAEPDFGTEVEGEGDDTEQPGTIDREKRKRDKKERRKEEKRRKLEENTKKAQ